MFSAFTSLQSVFDIEGWIPARTVGLEPSPTHPPALSAMGGPLVGKTARRRGYKWRSVFGLCFCRVTANPPDDRNVRRLTGRVYYETSDHPGPTQVQ